MLRKSGLLVLERASVPLGRKLWALQEVGKTLPKITHFSYYRQGLWLRLDDAHYRDQKHVPGVLLRVYIVTPFCVRVRPTDHQKEC